MSCKTARLAMLKGIASHCSRKAWGVVGLRFDGCLQRFAVDLFRELPTSQGPYYMSCLADGAQLTRQCFAVKRYPSLGIFFAMWRCRLALDSCRPLFVAAWPDTRIPPACSSYRHQLAFAGLCLCLIAKRNIWLGPSPLQFIALHVFGRCLARPCRVGPLNAFI